MDPRSLIVLCTLSVSVAQLCHDGWLFSGAVKKCYLRPNPAANFSQAVDICANFQGILAVIHSRAEQTFLYDAMKRSSLTSDSSVGYWIGLSDRQRQGRWVWADNVDSEYTNWGHGYPTREGGANCGAMELPSGKWRNLNCDDNLRQFVCETPALTFNARQLAVSHGLRIARAADDGCVDNDEQCPTYVSWCNDTSEPGLVEFMRQSCKKTCGFCAGTAMLMSTSVTATATTPPCVDLDADCLQLRDQCSNAMLVETMKASCKRTCGYCSDDSALTATTSVTVSNASSTTLPTSASATTATTTGAALSTPTSATTATTTACFDLGADCAQMQNQCNISMLVEVMKANCKKTCGYCSDGSASTATSSITSSSTRTTLSTSTLATTATTMACVDLNADCAQMQNQCNTPMLVEVMKTNCKRTCGYCLDGSASTATTSITSSSTTNGSASTATTSITRSSTTSTTLSTSTLGATPTTMGTSMTTSLSATPASAKACADCVMIACDDCAQMQSQCTVSMFLETMKANCMGACGYCTACVDLSPDCLQLRYQCTNPMFVETMKANCKKTCGYCSVGSASTVTTSVSTSSTLSTTLLTSLSATTATAKACADCVMIACDDCAQMQSQCTLSMFVETMKANCMAVCGYCTACVDLNPDCLQLRDQCTNPMFVETMKANCKKTCGYCSDGSASTARTPVTNSSAPVCVDLYDDCAGRVAQCNDLLFGALMKTNCARSCGFCPDSATSTTVSLPITTTMLCVDMISGCEQRLAQCNDPLFGSLMRTNCAKSCGFCSDSATLWTISAATTVAPVCADVRSDCAKELSDCRAPNFVNAMKANCAKTCGFCTVCEDYEIYCPGLKSMCNTAGFADAMAKTCPKTCEICPLKCVDELSDCPASLCKHPSFGKVLVKKCAKTCGVCEAT